MVEINGKVFYQEVDNDGILELVAVSGVPVWSTYADGLPWRSETTTYKWDGRHYTFTRKEFDPPEYRFQAVQDGDT